MGHRPKFVLRALLLSAILLGLGAPARAGGIGILDLTSDGHLGDFANEMTSRSYKGTVWSLNMDNGWLYVPGDQVTQLEPYVLTQPGGLAVRVFDFSTFSVPAGYTLTMFGASPAAVLSQGNILIEGNVRILNGGGAGGSPPPQSTAGGPGALGGGGGQGGGGYCDSGIITPGAGGGGGLASAGQTGSSGTVTRDCSRPAFAGGTGGQAFDLFSGVLQGGGGGGAGGDITDVGVHGSGPGGQGGGAIVFETPLNLTIAAGGVLNADGVNGVPSDSTGYGGGGAGGMIWFNVDGFWTNYGVVSVLGATGPGGAGSGGYINIDPQSIDNFGQILAGSTGALNLDAPKVVNHDGGVITGSQIASPVPEPSTGLLLLVPVAGLLLRRMRRAA